MKKAFACLAMALAITLAGDGGSAAQELAKLHMEMLYPVVQVESRAGMGSGTIIYSKKKDGKYKTYVLTNYHVIADSIEISDEWSPEEKKEIKVELRTPVTVRSFQYNNLSRAIGTAGKVADILVYDKSVDLALLKLQDTERGQPYVASVLPRGQSLYLFEKTWAVGSGLGKPPFPTSGIVSNLDQRFDGRRYILSSAPIIFGNSGGALFHYSVERGKYELIGVPSAASIAGFTTIVTHMAWSIPMIVVRKFLKDKKLNILGDYEEEDTGEDIED